MCKDLIIFIALLSCLSSTVLCFNVQPISSRSFDFGYSSFWDEKTESFYFVDYTSASQCLFRYDYKSKMLYGASIDAGYTTPSFLIPFKCCKNQYAVGIQRTVMIIEWDGISPQARYIRNATAVEQNPIFNTNGLDRGKVDPKGRLVAGTFRTDYCPPTSNPNGSLYLFERNQNVKTLITNIKSSAGFAYNTKEHLFYFLDYCNNVIWEFDWDRRTGTIGNQRVVFTFPELQNQPYTAFGIEIDSCGNLYTGLYRAGAILKINPKTGVVVRTINVPVETISGIGFGGPKLDVMFVLTTKRVTDYTQLPTNNSYPLALSSWRGQVLIITGLGAKGLSASKRLRYL